MPERRENLPDFCAGTPFGHNGMAMNVESRDSVSLKPAELDEFGQLLGAHGLSIPDEELDRQLEAFPLAVVALIDGEVHGVMLGSLERIGGTPAILWGPGAARKGKLAATALKTMTGELTRRAAISFPDEDVLVAVRLAQPSCYVMLQSYANVVPRPGYTPNGEDRAWGRRLAKRYGVEPHFDDRAFKVAVKGRRPGASPCSTRARSRRAAAPRSRRSSASSTPRAGRR